MTRARDLAAGTFELATGGVLKLETSDTTVTDGSVLGKIEFKAPDEASGTDANLTAAAIEAVAEGTFAADNNATELVFKTGASAAADAKMTLDSSGNLLVGKTATTLNTTGLNVNGPDGRLEATASGNVSGIFNRTSSDGGIVSFRKDGTTVGSIGTTSNTIGIHGAGSGDDAVGLLLVESGAGQRIVPCQENFTTNNGVVNLGWSTNRFKDLYLSGGVFLGGTGSANLLEDYEEGTFTPAIAYSTAGNSSFGYSAQVAHYVKVGDIVHFQLNVRINSFTKGTGSGSILVTGLPFTSHNTSGYANAQVSISLYGWTFSNIPYAVVLDNSTTAALSTMSSNAATAVISDPDSSAMVWLSGTYRAA
jgi:hypothetical protein